MEESKKSNIIIGLLILILVVLIIVFVPISVPYRCSSNTTAITRDLVPMEINYTVTYKAPLIFPSELKYDAENKIKIYADLRIAGFIRGEKAITLKEGDLSILQLKFNDSDIIGDIIRSLNIRDVTDKINKIKSVRLNSFKFNNWFEDKIRERDKAKHEADSLKNLIRI
jgi:hypothetical protein